MQNIFDLEKSILQGILLYGKEHSDIFTDIKVSDFADAENSKNYGILQEHWQKYTEICFIPQQYQKDLTFERYTKYLQNFKKTCVIKRILEQGITNYRDGNMDKVIENLSLLSTINTGTKLSRINWLESWEERSRRVKDKDSSMPIATDFVDEVNSIDKALSGGIRKGELGFVLGHLKVGKTMILLHLVYTAILEQRHIMYVSLEGTSELIERRMDAKLLQVETNFLRDSNLDEEVLIGFDAIFEAANKFGGKLQIVQGKIFEISVLDIKKEIKAYEIEYGRIPDMIIVDYSDIMIPTTKEHNQEAEKLIQITAELKNLANESKIAIWTAAQADVDSMKRIQKSGKVRWYDMSGSKRRAAIPDIFITLSQSEEEALLSLIRIRLDFARDSASGTEVYMMTDFAKASLIRKEPIDYDAYNP